MPLPILNDSELMSVQKPAQYLGGERGSVVKDDASVDVNFCLAFPDTYEVGMSHVGMQILYAVLNAMPGVWAERVYQPLNDMEALLRKKGAVLTSLESARPLSKFDIVGFSLQYELCMNGVLAILDLGGIALLAAERTERDPLVIGGGPVAYHPEPFADFFDAFLVGDGEEFVPEFVERYRTLKGQGLSRSELLRELSKIQGVYVPSFFDAQYSPSGKFLGMQPLYGDYQEVRRRIIATLENAPYPANPVVPNIKAIHDRLSIEVMRGCVRGCRFCQAGYLYRPQRERSPEEILKIAGDTLGKTGYEEISLLSLSTADYCSILPLLSALKEKYAKNDQLAISFPSTRVDALTPQLLQEVQQIRRSGFTIAPEAGTQRLRDVINKGVTDDQIIATCRNVFELGWGSVKLYFMIGLPSETDADVEGIVDLGKRIKRLAGRRNEVTVSVSTLVPKPHTPFQWAAQISQSETLRRQEIIRSGLKRTGVGLRHHEAYSSFLEGVFARGDRRLGRVILKAYQLGCRLDGWVEELNNMLWDRAFNDCAVDPHHYLHSREEDGALPWDHISCDIPKRYFLKEWRRANAVRTTPDCLTQSCSTCGACDYDAVRNVLFDRKRTETRLNIVNPPWAQIRKPEPAPASTLEQDNIAQNGAEQGSYKLREYLQTEVDTSPGGKAEVASPSLQRIRFQYRKEGMARFYSHLELASIFFRSARRAAIPVSYSRGFHPKPRLCFGPPLQLGVESACEFVDIYLSEVCQAGDLIGRFNKELPHGLVMVSAAEVALKAPSLQAIIMEQSYALVLPSDEGPSGALRQFSGNNGTWRSISVERKRKNNTSSVPLANHVRDIVFFERAVEAVVLNNPGGTLKPLEVFAAITGLQQEALAVKKTGVVFAV